MIDAIRHTVRRQLYGERGLIRNLRTVRMEDMVRLLNLPPKARILDLGGTPYVWNLIDHDFRVTLLNIPSRAERPDSGWKEVDGSRVDCSRFEVVAADATDLQGVFEDQSFDCVFSNSVIEHVGDETKQEEFAREARRIGHTYWVQTPGDRWPIEPHTFFPLQWEMRRLLHVDLERNGTRVLSKQRMQDLFPDGQTYVERVFGMEKSYALYRTRAT